MVGFVSQGRVCFRRTFVLGAAGFLVVQFEFFFLFFFLSTYTWYLALLSFTAQFDAFFLARLEELMGRLVCARARERSGKHKNTAVLFHAANDHSM